MERAATLDKMVRKGFIAEVIFEQRLKDGEKKHVYMKKHSRQRKKHTDLKQGHSWRFEEQERGQWDMAWN